MTALARWRANFTIVFVLLSFAPFGMMVRVLALRACTTVPTTAQMAPGTVLADGLLRGSGLVLVIRIGVGCSGGTTDPATNCSLSPARLRVDPRWLGLVIAVVLARRVM